MEAAVVVGEQEDSFHQNNDSIVVTPTNANFPNDKEPEEKKEKSQPEVFDHLPENVGSDVPDLDELTIIDRSESPEALAW